MTQYALINRNLTDTGTRARDITIVAPSDLHPSKPYWVPIVEETIDTSTGSQKVVSSWVETVEVARILRSRTVRDKTAEEIDIEDVIRVDGVFNQNGLQRALAQALFQVINNVRTLNSQTPLTVPQFKTYLKGMIR